MLERIRSARTTCLWLSACLVLTGTVPAAAADREADDTVVSSREVPLDVVEDGTSSRKALKEAHSQLPLNQLSREHRARADEVLKSIGMFRRLPEYSFEVDPKVYAFFAAYPDVAVSFWRAMKISKLEMWQTGRDSYEADTGDGTLGTIDVLYRGREQNLILCEGWFKSPLLKKPIVTKALIHLQTGFERAKDGTVKVKHRVNLFVSFPSNTVEAIAKIISPISNAIVDRNFREVSVFLYMMTLAVRKHPTWIEHMAGKLEGILDIRKRQLLKMAAEVYAAHHAQDADDPTGRVSLSSGSQPQESPAQTAASPTGM